MCESMRRELSMIRGDLNNFKRISIYLFTHFTMHMNVVSVAVLFFGIWICNCILSVHKTRRVYNVYNVNTRLNKIDAWQTFFPKLNRVESDSINWSYPKVIDGIYLLIRWLIWLLSTVCARSPFYFHEFVLDHAGSLTKWMIQSKFYVVRWIICSCYKPVDLLKSSLRN